MRQTIRRTIVLFGIIFLVGALASSGWAQDRKLTYTGWLGGFAAFKDAIQAMETEFEKQNPGVDLVRSEVPYGNALNQARVSILGKNAPDVMLLSPSWIAELQGIGGLEPLNDYLTEKEWSRIPKALKDAVTIDGKIYALAWHLGTHTSLLQPQSAETGGSRSGQAATKLVGTERSGAEDLRSPTRRRGKDLRCCLAHCAKRECRTVGHSHHLR